MYRKWPDFRDLEISDLLFFSDATTAALLFLMSPSSPPKLMTERDRGRNRNSFIIITLFVVSLFGKKYCVIYRSTLLMASGSGGGIWKQTPGKVLVAPSVEMRFQLSSEFVFRVSFSPLARESWIMIITTNKAHVRQFRRETAVCFFFVSDKASKLHLVCLPVTQRLHCDRSVGGDAS